MRVAQLGAGRIGAMHAEILSGLIEPGELTVADVDVSRAQSVADAAAGRETEQRVGIGATDALAPCAARPCRRGGWSAQQFPSTSQLVYGV